jgi:predicted DsbA family dithiol-disulfide isomerase
MSTTAAAARTAAARIAVTIDIVSDVICPWCYVGSRRLAAALAALPQIDATIRWRPFFLDPTLPAAGVDKLAHYYQKFGRARVDAMVPAMAATGASLSPPINFSYAGRIFPSLAAHCAIEAAWAAGGAPLQGAVVEALFAHYFTAAGDLDAAGVARVAGGAGLGAAAAAAAVAGAADGAAAGNAVRAEAAAWRDEWAVDGVPFFVIRAAGAPAGAAEAVGGAQEPRALAAAIARAVARGGAAA